MSKFMRGQVIEVGDSIEDVDRHANELAGMLVYEAVLEQTLRRNEPVEIGKSLRRRLAHDNLTIINA